AGLAPAWMEHVVTGCVGWDSALRADREAESEQLRITVADHPLDEGHIHEVADSVRAALVREGVQVTRVEVPAPGRHPHAAQMAAFIYLVLGFGVLSFALATLLMAGMVHALMSEEMKQIAIMQAIGAGVRQ